MASSDVKRAERRTRVFFSDLELHFPDRLRNLDADAVHDKVDHLVAKGREAFHEQFAPELHPLFEEAFEAFMIRLTGEPVPELGSTEPKEKPPRPCLSVPVERLRAGIAPSPLRACLSPRMRPPPTPPAAEAEPKINFATASPLDDIAHGASCPGHHDVRRAPVERWIRAMKRRGIERVLCLLTSEQLQAYEPPLLDSLQHAFGAATHVPFGDVDIPTEQTFRRALTALRDAEDANQKIVVHCTTGESLTAIILTTWVAMRHARSVDEAAALVIGHAARQGATRNPWEPGEDRVELLLRRMLPLLK